ncbi:hypothetical protein GGTG_10685 [Gaeumannomyces tritici R3-111a-1]|uniref:Uncharacterized protein n=1 Tax=Gaeumannomyces tritici (strain R3-111a-1) TaxID=644352 RepID=J3PB11_GAET3|nr:hypothetical protein GGTG_10685 [Gaeumannomyces tritici R3-111a-1]EJT71427.1 hypothetical protein GGTG_10685 [Gaeumannomyces tritici R3-111a-1]
MSDEHETANRVPRQPLPDVGDWVAQVGLPGSVVTGHQAREAAGADGKPWAAGSASQPQPRIASGQDGCPPPEKKKQAWSQKCP